MLIDMRVRWPVLLVAAMSATVVPAGALAREPGAAQDFAHGGWVEHAGSRWRLVATVRTGSMPWGVSVTSDGTAVYVTHVGYKDHDNVYRYDAASLEVTARAQFLGHAVESVPSPDGRSLVVSNSRRHELVVLDAASLELRGRHATGKIPKDLRLSPAGDLAYVADYGAHSLSVVDLARGGRRAVAVGKHPRGVGLSPDGTELYVANQGSQTLSVLDAATLEVEHTIRVCAAPRHIAVAPDGRLLLVSCFGSDQLAVVDAVEHELVRRVRVGAGPKTVAISHDGRVAVVADERGDSITIVDLRSWATLRLRLPADQPCGLAIAPDDRRVYVTARGSGELLVIERS
jgi:YVTN family beta-propeller protein